MLTPLELKFLAYEELVEIEPSTNIQSLDLIHAKYTNITPLTIVKLPLYISLELKNCNQAQIRLPSCYSKSSLLKLLELETENSSEYQFVNQYIFVTGKLIIKNSYNVDNKDELINLIDQIKEIRHKKTLFGISKMEGRALNLNNLTIFEWYEIKEIVIKPIEQRMRIKKSKEI